MSNFPVAMLAETTVGTDLSSWISSITGALADFSVANVITILVAILGITVGFGVFWFAYRLIVRKVSKAMKSGKIG